MQNQLTEIIQKQNKIKNMLQSSTTHQRVLCLRHKNQPSTHICTDLKCSNNPILCTLCFQNQINRTYHYDHQKNILPFQQAVNTISQDIKCCINPIQKVYRQTLGKVQYNQILLQIQKGQQLYQQFEDKIVSIKGQVELQMDLLMKQFQKIVTFQKHEYFKILDNYQKIYIKNIQLVKNYTQNVLEFNNSIKYYANINNLYLKLNYQSRKKSDWIVKTKKIVAATQKNIQNHNYTSQLSNVLNIFNRFKLYNWPNWKNQDMNQKINQFRQILKKLLNQSINLPELKNLEEEINQGFTVGGNKNYYY